MTKYLPIVPLKVRELFDYDPEVGLLLWKRRPLSAFPDQNTFGWWNTVYAGKPAGSLKVLKCGYTYRQIRVDPSMYLAHRIVWTWMTGEEPPRLIDHINCDSTDNRWANLRAATARLNSLNKRRTKVVPRSGFNGVHKMANGYRAMLGSGHKQVILGRFATGEEAHKAYLEARDAAIQVEIERLKNDAA